MPLSPNSPLNFGMRVRQDPSYYQNTHFQQSVVIETTLIQRDRDLQLILF